MRRESSEAGRVVPSCRLSALGYIAVCATLALTPGARAEAALRLVHEPPRALEAHRSVVVAAGIAGAFSPELVQTADVVVAADGGWTEIPMSLTGNTFSAHVPASLVTPPSLRYYIRLLDSEGLALEAPPGAPESGTFVVPVFESVNVTPADGTLSDTSSGVEILFPHPGEVLPGSAQPMAVLVDPPMSEPLEPMALLDGVDVTSRLEVDPESIVLVPADSLSWGLHRVTFVVLTPGRRVEASWSFYVGTAEEEPSESPAIAQQGAPLERTPVTFHGRVEFGWAVVTAETTAVDTAAVLLPYPEENRPTMDLYAFATGNDASLLVSVQYDPVYDDDVSWSATAETPRVVLEAGDVYPSLSGTTLDWAVGQGVVAQVLAGSAETELVAMRMSEADTVGGFGVYSRFALAAGQTLEWGSGTSASAVCMYAFDREGSVPDTQRIADPLRNSVMAALLAQDLGPTTIRVEAALSKSDGAVSGDGTALRAKIEFGDRPSRRASLEYVTSEPSFYSAGSFEYQPGESGLLAEYAFGGDGGIQASGRVGAFSTVASEYAAGTDGVEIELYTRLDLSSETPVGSLRSFASARYNRIPYESYEYTYYYAGGGVVLRRERARVSLSSSWSRSQSADVRDIWSGAADLRYELLPGVWSVTIGGRSYIGTSDTGASDYARIHWTAETWRKIGGVELTLRYELLDREDHVDPAGTYCERIFRASLGRGF